MILIKRPIFLGSFLEKLGKSTRGFLSLRKEHKPNFKERYKMCKNELLNVFVFLENGTLKNENA
jgi:hypothetical protein